MAPEGVFDERGRPRQGGRDRGQVLTEPGPLSRMGLAAQRQPVEIALERLGPQARRLGFLPRLRVAKPPHRLLRPEGRRARFSLDDLPFEAADAFAHGLGVGREAIEEPLESHHAGLFGKLRPTLDPAVP